MSRSTLCFSGPDSTVAEQMEAMKAAVEDVMDKCGQITKDAADAGQSSENAKIDIEEAERVRNIDILQHVLQQYNFGNIWRNTIGWGKGTVKALQVLWYYAKKTPSV